MKVNKYRDWSIKINTAQIGYYHHYGNNKVNTSTYSKLSFVPLNFFH